MKLGFIGLGQMGLPMALNLAGNGYNVAVHDINPDIVAAAIAHEGIEAAGSVTDAARYADVLFTCLPNNQIVHDTYLKAPGIIDGMAAGKISVDCSTIASSVTQTIASAFEKIGVAHVDASMLGSVPQAEAGELGFAVGGDRQAVERIQPLLDILGRFTKHAGPAGSGNRIKLIHQMLVTINAAAVAEATALCLATDTDLDCFYDVVCNGGGMAHSRYFENRVPRMRNGDFSPLFMLQFMLKDARLGRDLGKDFGFEAPLLNQAVGLFEQAMDEGSGGEDFSAVAHVYEQAIGKSFSDS